MKKKISKEISPAFFLSCIFALEEWAVEDNQMVGCQLRYTGNSGRGSSKNQRGFKSKLCYLSLFFSDLSGRGL